MSEPIRQPRDKSSVVTSFETYIFIYQVHRKYDNKIPGTRYIRGSHACGVRLFSWSMAAGLLAFSKSPVVAPIINHGPLSASCNISVYTSRASVAGGECRPRSEAPCSYIRTGQATRKQAPRLSLLPHAASFRAAVLTDTYNNIYIIIYIIYSIILFNPPADG